MSDETPRRLPHNGNGHFDHPAPTRQGKHSFGRNAWQVFKTIQARLRFIAILAGTGLVIGNWGLLTAYWEKWTRVNAAAEVAATDVEFYCPMHPQVVRDHQDKCPVCAMPLSKRHKGEQTDEPLPAGVVSRVQLSPYRIALGGIRTAEIGYQPLAREISTVGFVEFDERKEKQISARVKGRIDHLDVNVTGQTVNAGDPLASIYSPDLVTTVQNLLDAQRATNPEMLAIARDRLRLWDVGDDQVEEMLRTKKPITKVVIRSPISGHVIRKYQVEGKYVDEGMPLYDIADLSSVWIQAQIYEEDLGLLKRGQKVRATTRAYPGRVFEGTVAFVHPHLDRSSRTLMVRFDMDNADHDLRPGMYATVALELPVAQMPAFAAQAAKPGVGEGQVLAVPETAVIDTGTRRVVYREALPGVYEGVEVLLGPRCGAWYPILKGLEAGEKVATSGSFLIDAETRLNPSAGSAYFGASGGPKEDKRSTVSARPSMTEDEDTTVKAVLAKLPLADRKIAETQGFCPILRENRLGSMGLPIKVMVNGQPVFVCCKGCIKEAKDHPEQSLATVRAGKPATPVTPVVPPPVTQATDPKVKAALAKLSVEDRALAEAQGFCVIEKENRLGAMGVPVKVMLNGQPVFVCCKGCVDEAKEHPDQAIAAAAALRAKGVQK